MHNPYLIISYRLRLECGGCRTKKPLPLGMGCVTLGSLSVASMNRSM